MSLMNDALRKKNRENLSADPAVDAPSPPFHRRKAQKCYTGLAALLLLCAAIIGGIVFWFAKDKGSLSVKHPLPVETRKSAKDATDQSSVHVPPERMASPSTAIDANAPQANSADFTVTEKPIQAMALPKAVASDVSTNPNPIATAGLTTETVAKQRARKVVGETNHPPLEGTHPSPTEIPQKNERAFEPGPDSSTRSQQPQSPSVMRSRTDTPPSKIAKPASSKSSRVTGKIKPSSNSDTDLFYQKALACHRSGRMAEAARFYRNVLKTDANHRQALLNLAAVYIEQGYYNEAHPLLTQLEKSNPRPNGVLLNLAITTLGKDDPEAALSYLDQAESSADAPFWQIQFHRALALARLNRFSEALALYKQIETKRPDDYRVKFNLALTHDALGNYPQALHYYDGVLRQTDRTSKKDRPFIVERVGLLRRYLNTNQSRAKRQ